jgi:hypothetical protein
MFLDNHPDNYDPSAGDAAMVRDIDVLNDRDGGCRCQVVRRRPAIQQPGGEVVITDGPYLETRRLPRIGRGARVPRSASRIETPTPTRRLK